MASGHHFSGKIHIYIKDKVTFDVLVPRFYNLKVWLVIFNSLLMESVHRVFILCLSSLWASSIVLGICVPNLWVRFQYLSLTLDII